MTRPPVPMRLDARPRQGGLVVPWVSIELADGTFDLGNMHNTRVSQCYIRNLCQIDGERITPPYVFFLSDKGLEDMTTNEPPVHPECAAYSKLACPMVAGRMTHYRRTPSRTHGDAGKTCATPGCDCGGWVATPGVASNAGRAALRWHMVWCNDYAITTPDAKSKKQLETGRLPVGVPLGAKILKPLKIRPVTP